MLRLTQIERSRAESPVVRSREGLEALRSLALRLLRDLEPVNDRSAYFDVRLFEDSVSSLDIVRLPYANELCETTQVAWVVADELNDASSAQDAYWIGQALVTHGFLRRAARRGKDGSSVWHAMHSETVDIMRLRRYVFQ